MDTIRFILGAVIKLILILLSIALLLWLVGIFYPDLKPSKIINWKVFTADWLPSPKNYRPLFNAKTTDGTNGNVYVPGPAYNGYANGEANGQSGSNVDWVYYTATGTQVVRAGGAQAGTSPTPSGFADRSLYIRNMSLYEGGNIAYGLTFVGEARDTMFKNGIFTILVVDAQGKVITSMNAVNTQTWSIAGWSRFQATVPARLPSGAPCALIFLSANQSWTKVGMRVQCQ